MPLSPVTVLGGAAFTLHHSKKRPMERSPWAFTFFFFPQLPTLLSMPLSPPFLIEQRM